MAGGFLDVLGESGTEWRNQMIRRRYDKDEAILREGEVGDAFHVIESGRVLIEVSTPGGDVAALAVRGPGDVLGELAIVGTAGRRTALVTALEPTETLALGWTAVEELRRSDPSVDRLLLEILARKLQETMTQLLEVLFTPVETRVLRVLVRLADVFETGSGITTIRVRQEDVAAMAGTRRQTANRPLKAAEAKGAIAVKRGRIEVLDRALLEELAR